MHETILQADASRPPEVRGAKPAPIGDGVIDESTFRAIDGDTLFDTINSAETVVGQAVLYRSLTQPLNRLDAITAKQQAVAEITKGSNLRLKLESLVQKAAQQENHFYQLLYGSFVGFFGKAVLDLEFEGYGYECYQKGTQFVLSLSRDAAEIDESEVNSEYLNNCLEVLRKFQTTRVHSLMEGPVYRTESGIKSKQEKSPWYPAIIFRPTLFKPLFILLLIGIFVGLYYFNPIVVFEINPAAIPVLTVILVPLLGFYIPMVGTFDRDECIIPLRDIYRSSIDVHNTVEALGKIEELLVFDRYSNAIKREMVLAEFLPANNHQMVLTQARNPILTKDNQDYVANSLDLTNSPLTLISGPNSGGKTAICKTVTQVQLLSQIGCYVPAQKVMLTVADRIFYQVPEVSHLEQHGEGRFGTELRRTKEIFLASSNASLIVLDELSEGTTHEEKLKISFDILSGFYRRGGSTILITHNHELIDKLIEINMGQPLQVEFSGDKPSFRLVSGISRISHAEDVAKRLGFSKRDIEQILKEQGYTGQSQDNQ